MRVRPKVSIGIPVRNGERHLAECLDSVLSQTYAGFEVVVSDNASTDGTRALLRMYARRDARIRTYRNEEDRGAAGNFNRVFALAEGEYFKWMAADDVLARDCIAALVAALDERPDVVLAYPQSDLIDDRSEIIHSHRDSLDLSEETPGERFRRALRRSGRPHPVFGLARRCVLARTARFGPFPGADELLLAELSLHGKFHEVRRLLSHRRTREPNAKHDVTVFGRSGEFGRGRKGGLRLDGWARHLHYLAAVERSPLSRVEKLELTAHVLSRMFLSRKDLVGEIIGGMGRLFAPRVSPLPR